MRRTITIAMSIEAPTSAGMASLYRAGLAQIALALANGTACAGPRQFI